MFSKMQFSVLIVGCASILTLIGHVEARPGPERIKGWLNYMPFECRHENVHFCATPHEKPLQDHIDKLLGESKLVLTETGRTSNRDGVAPSSSCEIKRHISPMRVYNIFDKTYHRIRIVVQSEKRSVSQEFEIQECLNPNTSITKYNNSRLLCQQVTMDYSFLVLTLNGTSFEMIKSFYPFPVYCDELLIS